MEKTLVLIKPDAIQRNLIGEIITRFEDKGLKVAGIKMMRLTDDILDEHYSHLKDRPFFEDIKRFMMSIPVIAMCIEGFDAVDTVRAMAGVTLSREAESGTIRGDLGMSVQSNLVHASDSLETAEEELKRFFGDEEVFEYEKALKKYVYAQEPDN